jgi:hypothetical protein
MPKLIMKGLEKCGISRAFTFDSNMEVNATGTLFTTNLEIDENVETKADLNPTTFVLEIIE